ncbi:MAG: response regulator [Anaerolineaceae bacterium]
MTQEMESFAILLVDDSQVDVDLTILALSRINFNQPVQIARDGAETLEIVEKWEQGGPTPKLILLDIKLPKVSGLEVLKVLKNSEITKFIPVVMLTSSNNDSDIRTAYEYGANSFITKPVDFDKFMILTKAICDYWIGLNVRPEVLG